MEHLVPFNEHALEELLAQKPKNQKPKGQVKQWNGVISTMAAVYRGGAGSCGIRRPCCGITCQCNSQSIKQSGREASTESRRKCAQQLISRA